MHGQPVEVGSVEVLVEGRVTLISIDKMVKRFPGIDLVYLREKTRGLRAANHKASPIIAYQSIWINKIV